MAIISKIREHSGIAVGVVAVSLVLFMVGSDLLSNNSIIRGSRTENVGEISGHEIPITDYNKEVKELEDEYALNQNKNPDEAAMQGIREQAWNMLIFKNGYIDEINKLGLTVTKDEQVDMVQGENIHPVVKSSFTDPKTGKFDKQMVKNFLSNIEQAASKGDNEQAMRQYAAWVNFERKLPDDRLRTKYENMLKGGTYVTKDEAKREYENQNTKAEVKYLFIPYSLIADSTIKPTDQQLTDYLNAHKGRYKAIDSRTLEYVQFRIQPSAEDTAYFRNELDKSKAEFASAENDTLYAAGKSDKKAGLQTLGVSELPQALSGIATTLQKGQVYGPFVIGGTYTLYKVKDIANEGGYAAKASHILFKWKSTSPEDKKECLTQANKILKEIKGGKSFEDMARQYGTDGTASQGGDLGWFTEGRMVKPFEKAVFDAKAKGLLPSPVETDFGYHLIKITETKTNLKYKVVAIENTITPGEKTKDETFRKAVKFQAEATSKDAFEAAAKKDNLALVNTGNLQKNQYSVNDIQEGRQIVRWAFRDAKIGGVSDVFEASDRYVVALLTKKSEEGVQSVEDFRDALTAEVRKEEKAKQIIAKLKGAGLEEMQAAYGTGAIVNTVPEINAATTSMQDIGYDPATIGRIFGAKAGKSTKPFQAENGVVVLNVVKQTPAPEVADFNTFKTQILQRRTGNVGGNVSEAIKELSKIKDDRILFQ